MKRTFVTLNGKCYTVRQHPETTYSCGTTVPPRTDIWVQWEVPSIADRYSAHPTMISKSASVSPFGRIGKKVMEAVAAQGEEA